MTLDECVHLPIPPRLCVSGCLQLQAFLILPLKVSRQTVLSSAKGERNVKYVK